VANDGRILVGNRVTVTLNGQRVQDNTIIMASRAARSTTTRRHPARS
jgi:hypothetical protein